MVTNFKSVSSVNNRYIHLNDNGVQTSQSTNKADVKYIQESIENELRYINYTITQLETELSLYIDKINSKIGIIESLTNTINEGIENNISKFKRSLSNEHFSLECNSKELDTIYFSKSGILGLLNKLNDTKFKYHTILRECKSVLIK